MNAPYKIGAVLRKHDGGFFKLVRYKKCSVMQSEIPCSASLICHGQALVVQKLFDNDDKETEFCPVRGNAMMFDEMKISKTTKRFVMLGEGWISEEKEKEIQDNEKRNRSSGLQLGLQMSSM